MRCKNSFFWLLLLLVAYLPWQIALNLTPDIDLMSGRVLLLGLFFFWLIVEFYQKRIKVRNFFADKTALALAVFFLLAAASIFTADNQIWGWRKLLVFISIFPLFWLTRFLASQEKERRILINVIIGGAALAALVALAQFGAQFIFGSEAVMNFWAGKITPLFSGASFGALVATNPSWLVEVSGQTLLRAMGLFPDPHMLSFYLGLVFPFALARLFFEKKFRWLLFTVNCLLLTVLLLTFSRGGYLGLLASLAVFGTLGWRYFGRLAKKFLAVGFLLALIILLLVGWPVVARLGDSFNLTEGSNLGRLAIWQDSWGVIKKNPIVGVGLGNYPAVINFGGVYRSAITSHNLYLDIWAEMGIFSLLAWLALIFTAAKKALKARNQNPIVALGVLSSLAYFSSHSFFETAIFNPTVLAFLMIVLGLAVVEDES